MAENPDGDETDFAEDDSEAQRSFEEAYALFKAQVDAELKENELEHNFGFRAPPVNSASRFGWPRRANTSYSRRSFSENEIRYIYFDPLSSNRSTARINPLDAIRVGTIVEVRDAARIADALMGLDHESPHCASDINFDEHGSRILSALLLHAVYTPDVEPTLSALLEAITNDLFYDFKAFLMYISRSSHDPDGKMKWIDVHGKRTLTHPAIYRRVQVVRLMNQDEMFGIHASINRRLMVFGDPLVAQNTETTDFEFDDLFNGLALAMVPCRDRRLAPVHRAVESILSDRMRERSRLHALKYPPFLTAVPTRDFIDRTWCGRGKAGKSEEC